MPAPSEPSLESVNQRVSYGIAFNTGANLVRQGLKVDVAAFLAGLEDGVAGKPGRVPESALREAFAAAQAAAEQVGNAQRAKLAEASQAFLDENKARPRRGGDRVGPAI